MARTKQTARKPTAGQAPGVSVAQQKMIVPPGYIVKRSKKTGKKYCVKNKWADTEQPVAASSTSSSEPPPMPINPMPIKPYRQPAGTLVDGEIVFQWHHEKPIVVM